MTIASQSLTAQSFFDYNLQKHVVLSPTVIEADVIAARPYQVPNSNMIYTIYTLKVYKEFKGKVEDKIIEVKTVGGQTADRFLHASHTPRLSVGQRGIVYIRSLKVLENQTRNTVNYLSVNYQKSGSRYIIDLGYGKTKSVKSELYAQIEKYTGRKFRQIAFTPEEIADANWRKEQGELTLAAFGNDATIQYTFENETFTGVNNEYLEFDITAQTNAINSEYGHAEIYLAYDTSSFGSNVVANGVFAVTKEYIIQGSDYTLNAIDVGPNELIIEIDVIANPLNLYDLTQQSEDLLHIKMDISGISSWGILGFQEDSMFTDFYIGASGIFSEVYHIIAEDSIIAGVSGEDTTRGIIYTFENERITTGATNLLEFDVYISGTDSGTALIAGQIYFDYDVAAFGPSVVLNGNLTVTEGSLMTGAGLSYSHDSIDNLTSRVSINVVTPAFAYSPFLLHVPQVKQQLLHVTIAIADCNINPNIRFHQSGAGGMNGQSFYAELGTTILQYDTLIANDYISIPLCANSTVPYITSISPLKLSAGVGDTVTIKGVNFGGNPVVELYNVEYLTGASAQEYAFLQSDYYEDRTDTLIRFRFPSFDYTSLATYSFGSGRVIVRVGANRDTSRQPLEIHYSILNHQDSFGRFYRPSLATRQYNFNGGGGYVFRADTSLTNIPDAKECVVRALKTWRCDTRVNFSFGKDTALVYEEGTHSGINIITFAPDSVLGEGTYGSTYNAGYRVEKCTGSNEYFLNEVDIQFNRRYLSSPKQFKFAPYDSTRVSFTETDFTNTTLHEIGHAHLLEHAVERNKVMYIGAFRGPGRRTLSLSEFEGGTFVMKTNNRLNAANCRNTSGVSIDSMEFWPLCIFPNSIETLEGMEVNVYPNPFEHNISIERRQVDRDWKIELIELSGRKIKKISMPRGSKRVVLNTQFLAKGVYFIRVLGELNQSTIKIVKQ